MIVRLSVVTLVLAALAAARPATSQPTAPLLLASIALTHQLDSFAISPASPAETAPGGPAPTIAPPSVPKAAAALPEPPDAGEYGIEYELSLRDADSFLNRLSKRWKQVVEQAMTYLGTPYRRGGSSRHGIDCSGLVGAVYSQQGLDMPRTAAEQFAEGAAVVANDLRPGDLVFFRDTYKRGISHVGIFIGDGRFIHAAGHRRGTIVSELSRSYYRSRYAGARRLASPAAGAAASATAAALSTPAAAATAATPTTPATPAITAEAAQLLTPRAEN